MTSKTFSSKQDSGFQAVFRWQLRRSAPLGLIYTAAFLVISCYAWQLLALPDSRSYYYGYLILPLLFVSLALPPFQLGFFQSRRQADLFHALPASRRDLYWGSALSGLCWVLMPMLPSLALTPLLSLIGGWVDSARVVYLACTIGSCALLGSLCYVFFLLAAACSGTVLEYVANSLLFSGCVPALVFSVYYYCTSVIPGCWIDRSAIVFSNGNLICASSPPFGLFLTLVIGSGEPDQPYPGVGLWMVVWWIIFALLLLYLGDLACRRWKSEHAESPQAFPRLKLLLGGLGGSAATLAAGLIAADFSWNIPQCLFFMALILLTVWLVIEFCGRKTLRGFYRHWGQPLLSLALTVALLLPLSLGMGLDTAVPEPEKVESIYLYTSDYSVEMSSSFDVLLPEEWENGADADHLSSNINAAVSSPENREKVEALQKKLVEMERARQYPYLPGRNPRNYFSESNNKYMNILYDMGEDYSSTKSYRIAFDRLSPEAKSLYEECAEMMKELLCSEENVTGLFPLCAIDALDKVSMTTGFAPPEDGKPVTGDMEKPLGSEEQKEEKELSAFKDEQEIRQKLEAALLDDFTHGRARLNVPYDYSEQEQAEQDEIIDTFELWYKVGKTFRARGGMYKGEPAQGKEFCLSTGDYTYSWSRFRVYPGMTSTTAVLKEIFR